MEELLSACTKELSRASQQASENYINNKEEVVENLWFHISPRILYKPPPMPSKRNYSKQDCACNILSH
jgi:hypothetical protein